MQGYQLRLVARRKHIAAVEDRYHPLLRTGFTHPHQYVRGKDIAPHRNQVTHPMENYITLLKVVIRRINGIIRWYR